MPSTTRGHPPSEGAKVKPIMMPASFPSVPASHPGEQLKDRCWAMSASDAADQTQQVEPEEWANSAERPDWRDGVRSIPLEIPRPARQMPASAYKPPSPHFAIVLIDAITSGFHWGAGGKKIICQSFPLIFGHFRSFSATAADICNLVSRQACGEWGFENRNSVQHSFQVRDSS